MDKKEKKNAAKILFTWKKAMPFYYAAASIILLSIVFLFN